MNNANKIDENKIYDAIKAFNGQAKLIEIYNEVKRKYPGIENSYKDEESYKATIRSILENYSSDSEKFKNKKDLFYIVLSKRSGVWGIRDDFYEETKLQETEKYIQSKSRLTQGKFRAELIKIYKKCPFTDIDILSLLTASHIIPWKDDKNNRNNPHNGILLSIHLDKLFDRGLISINKNGFLIYKNDEIKTILKENFILKTTKLSSDFLSKERINFLDEHRKRFNIPEDNTL